MLANIDADSNTTFTNSVKNLGNGFGNSTTTFTGFDTTPSVAGAYYCETSGSVTTISNFDDGVKGQEIVVVSKIGTIYDVTGTNLKGGTADLNTTTNDLTKWVYDGTNWILISFTDQSDDLS